MSDRFEQYDIVLLDTTSLFFEWTDDIKQSLATHKVYRINNFNPDLDSKDRLIFEQNAEWLDKNNAVITAETHSDDNFEKDLDFIRGFVPRTYNRKIVVFSSNIELIEAIKSDSVIGGKISVDFFHNQTPKPTPTSVQQEPSKPKKKSVQQEPSKPKKKAIIGVIIGVFIALLAIVALIFVLKSCSGSEPSIDHNHSYASAWATDDGYHWHVCSGCSEKGNFEAHAFGPWTITKAATETATGTQERSCTVCGYKQTETIAKLDHTHSYTSEWVTDDGHHWHVCSDCSEKGSYASHTFSSWTVTKTATETSTGAQERSCTVCGYKQTETIAKLDHIHSYASEWATDDGYHWHVCSGCSEKGSYAVHTFGSWTVTKVATETSTGTKERSCTVCGYKQTETIAKLNHTHKYASAWTTNEGYHWHVCSGCSEKGDFASHTFGSWTVTKAATETSTGTKDRTCTVCGYNQTETIAKLTVSSISVKTMPSKTSYVAGETLNTSGLVIGITYNDGSTSTATSGFTCSKTVLKNSGTQEITVTYSGKTAKFNVNVTGLTAKWNTAANVTITVSRTSSPNGGASNGTISSGTSVYYGDVLKVTYTPATGYSLESNGKTSITVSGNVSSNDIYASVSVNKYTASWSTGTGYTITVNRNSSPYGGASVGSITNGSAVYYGDVLNVTYTKANYYTIINKGKTNITVSGNVTSSDIFATAQLNPLSDWTLRSNVPSDAQIVNQKWTYTRTQTKESKNSSESGWTLTGSYWNKISSGSKNYASFPSGFDTSNSIYTSFAKSAYSASETSTTKREVSNTWAGYVYWHWMYSKSYDYSSQYYLQRTIADKYCTYDNKAFHYFYAITSTVDCPSIGNSYVANYVINKAPTTYNCVEIIPKTSGSNEDGRGTPRMLRFDYYTSTYTDYEKIFQYRKVTSEESSTKVTNGGEISNVQEYVRYRAK